MLKKCVKVVALAFAVGGGFPDSADAARPREIVCEGEYGGHLQGVATDGDSLYWSFTVEVVRTDLAGRVLATTGPVPSHHGDLCVKAGVVYVAVNLGSFNQMDRGKSEVRAYDAETMTPRGMWSLPEMGHGAGGMTQANGRFFVIGGLPATIEENYVYEYDADFRFVRRHSLATGFTLMGIQTAAFEDGRFLFGIYGGKGNPRGVLECPADLSSVTRRVGLGDVGIVKLGGKYWTGRVRGRGKRNRGMIVLSEGYPSACPVYRPEPTGKGALKVFHEGRDAAGWADCGYRLAPNGYKTMTNSEAFVPMAEVSKVDVFPAAGIGGDIPYSIPDIVRGVRRAAECDEVFSLHVPGVPEDLSSDKKLAEALRAACAEARRLGMKVDCGFAAVF